MSLPSNPFLLPLSLVIYLFSRAVSARCIGRLGLFVCLSVLRDDDRGNMRAHIVIDKKDGKMVHLLTLIILVLYISQYIEIYIRVVRISETVGNMVLSGQLLVSS